MTKTSLIVPVLNESLTILSCLENLLSAVSQSDSKVDYQIVVSDAGSTDDTVAKVKTMISSNSIISLKEFTYSGGKSIGKTILQAVEGINFDRIVICPADVRLSAECLHQLNTLPLSACGGFLKRYDHQSFIVKIYEFIINNIRTCTLKNLVWTNAFFLSREAAQLIPTNGFMEDVQLSDAIKAHKLSLHILKGPVEVSFRRYVHDGILYRILANLLIIGLYRIGYRNVQVLKKIYSFNFRRKAGPVDSSSTGPSERRQQDS